MNYREIEALLRRHMNLQLFADGDGGAEDIDPEAGGDPEDHDDDDDHQNDRSKPKYSDEDLDKILSKRFSKWQRQKEKEVSEAKKLSDQNAAKKSEDRIKDLEDKVSRYEHAQAHSDMMSEVRKMATEKGYHLSDKLIDHIATDDADTTREITEEILDLIGSEVQRGVKAKIAGTVPPRGKTSTITREDIMKVADRNERQKLINEHLDLF